MSAVPPLPATPVVPTSNDVPVAPERAPPFIVSEPVVPTRWMLFAPPLDETEAMVPDSAPVERSSAGPLPLMDRSATVRVPKLLPLIPFEVALPVVTVRPRTVFAVPAPLRLTAFTPAVALE